jgi:hypothetical protein
MNPGRSALLSAAREVWSRHGGTLRLVGVIYLGVAAVGKAAHAVPRLVRDLEPWSALDLRYRYGEVHAWFAGQPVYGVVDGAVYPPASHVILWPFLGWVSLDGARVIWAVTTLAAAGALAWLLFRAAAPASSRDRLLVAGLALAMYSLPIALYVGQMGMHVMAFAAFGAALLITGTGWGRDLLAAALLAAALVKPTVSLPLVVAALILGGRLRPVALLAAAYGALTVAAAALQPADLVDLFRDWLAVASVRVPIEDGVPNLHRLMLWAGLGSWMTHGSMLVLAVMTGWMWTRRRADPWILLGIAGLVCRFWAHSTLYDDALLLLPTLALFRVAFREDDRRDVLAGWLFAGSWVALLTPVWAYYSMGSAVAGAIHAAQAILWLCVLVFLAVQVWRTTD